jgi:3-methyladenine DNA glycosylase AlkD
VVPKQRELVRKYKTMELDEVARLLNDSLHECRLTALFFIVHLYRHAETEDRKTILYQFYCRHISRVNNWDLVDLSAPAVVGEYLLNRDKGALYSWATGHQLWEQRIAIIATFTFIKHHHFLDTLNIARLLLNHHHDLIHKAVGWMLREVGKRDLAMERLFLDEPFASASQQIKTYQMMPRTMLRYAIEKFTESLRQQYLKGTI